MTVTPREKFQKARAEIGAALVERDDEIDLVLTALLCGQHALLVSGTPGLAKSLLLDSVMAWMNGAKFSVLLTKFTTPEEVFGPVDLRALLDGKMERITTNRLPEADACFVDEIN